MLTCSIALGQISSLVFASSEAESHKRIVLKPIETERVIRSSLDSYRGQPTSSRNEQVLQKNLRPRSPSLSSGESVKRRTTENDDTSCKENSPESGSDSSSTKGNNFLLTDAKSRKKLYYALQKNEHDVARAVLMIMAINKLADQEKLDTSYQTLNELLPRFNKTIKENFPGYLGYTYVDILCSFAPWHSALMFVFFDELKKDILRPTPQVLRTRYYAVKWLEETIKRVVQEVLTIMATENPALLTSSVSTFLDPDFVAQTFEAFLYQEITQKITESKSNASQGSGAYEASTPPVGIFEKLAFIESQESSPIKESIQTTRS